jgi:hypothetical protein
MMGAAIGVFLAAGVSRDAMFSLGIVLTAFSALAIGLNMITRQAFLTRRHVDR